MRFIHQAVPLAVLSLMGGAFAQNAPSSAKTLPEVVVSAGPNAEDQADAKEGRVRPMGAREEEASINHSVTQSVSVVSRQDIERINTLSTLELMGRVPGASVSRNGGMAGSLSLRGVTDTSMRVPIFIDGDRFRGRPVLYHMLVSPTELERVEIIRGPASSRFGSDALGGLVNYVTRQPSGNNNPNFQFTGGDAALTYQSNGNALQGDIALEGAGNGLDLRVFANSRRSNNYDTPAGEIYNSDFRGSGGGLVLGYKPDALQRFEFSTRAAYVTYGTASTLPAYPIATSVANPLKVWRTRLAWTRDFTDAPISNLDAAFYISRFKTSFDAHNELNPLRVTDTRSHVVGPLIWGGHLNATIPTASTKTVVGMDFMREKFYGNENSVTTTTTNASTGAVTVSSTGNRQINPDKYQTNIGLFANTEWTPADKWMVTASTRYDWIRSNVDLEPLPSANLLEAFRAMKGHEETALTGSLGLSYFATDTVELVGSVGRSFRLPWTLSMFSGGFTGSSYTIPNPSIKPEWGTTFEVGNRLHFENATVELTAFRTNYRDYIENSTTTYMGLPATQEQNVGKAQMQGLEMNWRWQATRQFNLFGHATYLHGTNQITDAPLANIAPWSGLLGLQYVGPNKGYALTGEVNWAKGQSRYDSKSEYPAAGYAVLNLNAQFQLDRLGLPQMGNTQLVVSVNNVFDKLYRTAATTSNVNYPTLSVNPLLEPGRSVNVTLRTRF